MNFPLLSDNAMFTFSNTLRLYSSFSHRKSILAVGAYSGAVALIEEANDSKNKSFIES